MKNILKIVAFFVTTSLVISCSDNYFDVNTPPDAIDTNSTALKDVLSPAIQNTFDAQYSASVSVAQVSQHISSALSNQDIDKHYFSGLDSFWFTTYVKALANIKVVEDKAIATNSSHYLGIAQILKAINLGLATDLYGDIPYSEASQAGLIPYPKYDSQESIYAAIDGLFTDAIAKLSVPNTSIINKPGKEDLVYGGDISKWIKAAYSLKARYQLHLSKINPNAAATNALASLTKGFTSNADDFQLVYNTINTNPWYANQLGLNTGNISFLISNQLINVMNGKSFPFATVTMDPRLLAIVDIRKYPNPASQTTNPDPMVVTNYNGIENGTGANIPGQPGANAKIGIDFFYSKTNSPIILMSFSEAKFIEAEANFILAGGNASSVGTNAAANTAYLAGITANIDKLAVTTAAKTAYIADASISKGATALELKDIMRQKFIALYLNPETFTDYRRYNFSPNVFVGLKLPKNTDPNNNGQWIRRFVYPNSEKSTNASIYDANFKSMITPVWWDK
ncbi:hypothetical protein RCH18_000987 [Flavobacterium sp. PL11]|jgi:hypothetical protein|uniref:SusD/RagB family nutrient-binding outer membrane lipoprotein n=1 Tax=Flavobacterium sp. PL11 TaxID=3071717 RepID=UPI002E0BFFD5|nr:hypothetical protein [Flavobacterium sp. PL11]